MKGEGCFSGQEGHTGQAVEKHALAVLSAGDTSGVDTAELPARILILAGRPLNEPVALYGRFVKNTKEEVMQAVENYERGTFLD